MFCAPSVKTGYKIEIYFFVSTQSYDAFWKRSVDNKLPYSTKYTEVKKECEDDLIKLLEASNCACLAVFPSTCTPYIHLKTCHCLGSVII